MKNPEVENKRLELTQSIVPYGTDIALEKLNKYYYNIGSA